MSGLTGRTAAIDGGDERQLWAVRAPLKTEEISVTVMKATQESFIAAPPKPGDVVVDSVGSVFQQT
jgi:hypothetical protein